MDNNVELSHNEQRSIFAKSFPGYKKVLVTVSYLINLGSLVWITHSENLWGVRTTIAVMLICFLSAMVSYRTYFGKQQGYMQLARSFFSRSAKAFKSLGMPLVIVGVFVLYYLMPFDKEIFSFKMLMPVIICGYSFIIVHEIFFRGLLLDGNYYAKSRVNPKTTAVKVLFLEALVLLLFLGTFIPKLLLFAVLIYSRYKTEVSMLEENFFTDSSEKKCFTVLDSLLETTTMLNFVIISIIAIIAIGR